MQQAFTQDTANQIANTKGFRGLVDETAGNITQLQALIDTVPGVARGEMAAAFTTRSMEIRQVALLNNNTYTAITDGLQHGIALIANQEAAGASFFQQGVV
ncbi:hypothetical protein ACRCUN_23540 [Mycobacterium sp. LTG2003]